LSKKEKLARRLRSRPTDFKDGNHLHYRGYTGSIRFSEEDAVFFGKVIGIKALVSFEGDSVSSITSDFHKAVDEYLEFCADQGKTPEKPYKGSFNVRISSELHRKLAVAASVRGMSLNSLVEHAIRQQI